MAIQNDFIINPKTKVIRHDPNKSTVYTAVEFYSYLQDTFDEPGFLSYEIPIRFNTPTSFTMLNGWFLDDGDGSNILQYLTGGGIDTLGYSTVADPVLMIDLDYSTRSFITSDKDQTITHDGTDIGPLLSYKDDYPDSSKARIWVRDTNTGSETVVPGEIIDVTLGDGNYTAADYSAKGDNIYHNLFTIASFPGSPDPQIYVYQNHPVDGDRTRIAEWSAFTNWDRGSIDVLITTQLAGSLIDGGNITTFVRQTADLFTFVESILTTSGRTPIATETSADEVNITEGEHYLLYDGLVQYSFVAGDVIADVPLGIIDEHLNPPSWYAEVVSVDEFADTTTGLLELRGLRGTIPDNANIYVNEDLMAISNGTEGDTLFIYQAGPSADPVGGDLGLIALGGSSGARRLIRGFDTAERYVITQDDPTGVTGTNRNPYYVDYTASENVTALTGTMDITLTATPAGAGTTTSNTLISGFNDITVAHMNGTVTVDTFAGTFSEGERVTWTGGGEGVMIYTDGSSTMMLGNVQTETGLDDDGTPTVITGDISGATCEIANSTGLVDDNTQNFEFSLQNTGALYSVFIEGGSLYQAVTGRTLTDIYAYLQYYLRDGQSITDRVIYTSDGTAITQVAAEEYIRADATYAATKAAPYGTLAGGVFFGAQAVWLQGMSSADNNNINLTDSSGTLRQPFTSITISVTNTRVDDRVAIFLDADQDGLPDKDQYTSHASNNVLNGETFDRDAAGGSFPNDTPTGGITSGQLNGTFIVVDNTLNKQHRYRYNSFNATGGSGDDGQLVLPPSRDGTTDASGGQVLTDTSEDWSTGASNSEVLIGDIIHRTTGTLGFAYATDVTNASTGTILTTLLEDTSGTANPEWATGGGDGYQFHSLVKTYTDNDTFFIPYMDAIEDTGTDVSTGTVSVDLTFVANRFIVLEVRNVEASTQIVPFTTTGTITNTGYTQGVIRNEDTVFTS